MQSNYASLDKIPTDFTGFIVILNSCISDSWRFRRTSITLPACLSLPVAMIDDDVENLVNGPFQWRYHPSNITKKIFKSRDHISYLKASSKLSNSIERYYEQLSFLKLVPKCGSWYDIICIGHKLLTEINSKSTGRWDQFDHIPCFFFSYGSACMDTFGA